MVFRIPSVWKRTSRYAEGLRSLVRQDGTLSAHTSLGCYPIFYFVVQENDRFEVCPGCASNPGEVTGKVIDVDVYWEDREMACGLCESLIESAY
jgi:hypothetical protein